MSIPIVEESSSATSEIYSPLINKQDDLSMRPVIDSYTGGMSNISSLSHTSNNLQNRFKP
jgi:hypothetical protein